MRCSDLRRPPLAARGLCHVGPRVSGACAPAGRRAAAAAAQQGREPRLHLRRRGADPADGQRLRCQVRVPRRAASAITLARFGRADSRRIGPHRSRAGASPSLRCSLRARICSAEQRFSFAQSSFVAYDFQRTVAAYFGIDPLLVVIVSVFDATVVRYVVYFPTLILAQNFYNSARPRMDISSFADACFPFFLQSSSSTPLSSSGPRRSSSSSRSR